MCRIAGIIYGSNREEINTAEIASLLYPELVFQGPHAWGWATYNEETEIISWEKTPGKCDTKAAEKRQLKRIDPNAKWAILHTRFATHGSPEDNRNNHPIEHGNIIGVHNGVLRNHEEVLKITGRQDPETEVDSEAIFAAVNKWGSSAGMRRIAGDAVAVYADVRKPHLVHIARSHGRALHLGWTEKGNLIFASDMFALRALEPFVKFVKFSQVSENRILILRNGQIIQKHRFAPVTPKPTFPKWTGKPLRRSEEDYWNYIEDLRGGADINAMNNRLATQLGFFDQREDRAKRRGAAMFPKADPKERTDRKTNKPKNRRSEPLALALPQSYYDNLDAEDEVAERLREENDFWEAAERGMPADITLIEWNGVWLTPEEYEEALESPELYNGK